MAATTSRTRRLAEARPAAIAPIPARPSATVRRVESGCTEVAATTTRPGSLTSRSHSVRRNGSSVCGRVAGWLDMADLPRQHMPRKPWSGGLRRGEAGLLRPGVRLGRHHHPPPRSEEHTCELQSRENLVCRRLLEKKKGKGGLRGPTGRQRLLPPQRRRLAAG